MNAAWKNGLAKLADKPNGEPCAAANAYRAAERRRQWGTWETRSLSGDAALYQDHQLVNDRLRDLFRNEPVMRKCLREMSKGVVGAEGVQTFAEALLPDGKPGEQETDDEFNFLSDDLWEEWCANDADAEGRLTFQTMQWQNFEEAVGQGASFAIETIEEDPDRLVPLAYQLIEAEQLDTTLDRPATGKQNRIVRGIEFDARNRAQAYYFYDVHPNDTWQGTLQSTRVPASRVLHTFFPDRPSQHLGASLFTANVQPAKDLDWYLGNELTAAAIGALFSVMINRKNGAGSGTGFTGDGTTSDSDAYGNSEARLGRGIVFDAGPDDDIKIIESKRPNANAAGFIELILRLAGQAAGLSLGRVTGDYKGTSYSASRAMHLDDEAFFKVLRAWYARSFVLRVRKRFTAVAAAQGLFAPIGIGARQFRNRRREMMRVKFQGAGREQLDPEKETNSAIARIRSGLSTHEIECGLRGFNWRRLGMQRWREKKFFKKWEVEPDLTANGAPPAAEETTQEGADAAAT